MFNKKKLINQIFGMFNLHLTRKDRIQKMNETITKMSAYSLLHLIDQNNLKDYVKYIKLSKSQIAQDLFVLSELNFKKKGFFVEFGATNGVELSNTYLLEKYFDWSGILSEPAKIWHKNLKINRKVNIETDCIWSSSNHVLSFNETEVAELSSIDNFAKNDFHSVSRKNCITYNVKTISLNDLLDKYDSPLFIDYLSIDTEGSEYDILSSFDFSKYKIKIITCEHNYSSQREKIFQLLTKNNYIRKYTDISKFDDWYVLLE